MSRRIVPIVGISADFAPEERGRSEACHFSPHRYCRAVEAAGGAPVLLPALLSAASIRKLTASIDALLISGGDFDIHPRYYGEKPHPGLGTVKPDRTRVELALAAAALERDMPLLGICGGAQAINVVLGGTLYQDIPSQLPEAGNHQQSALKETGGHRIRVRRHSRLHRLLERLSLEVNTTHHQSIKRPGRGLIVDATADDGVIEGVESESHRFVLGLQWHPEVLAARSARQQKIFAALIAACAAR